MVLVLQQRYQVQTQKKERWGRLCLLLLWKNWRMSSLNQIKEILTKHFLESCNKILPVIAEFGNAVYPVTHDIRNCVVRLQYRYSSDPSKFNYLYSFVQFETFPSKFKYSWDQFDTFSLNLLTRSYRRFLRTERSSWRRSKAMAM